MKNFIFVMLLVQALLSNSFGADNAQGHSSQPDTTSYDELYHGGILRQVYQPIGDYIQNLPTNMADYQKFLKSSKKAFKGDNALDPVPRILTPDESREITTGVDQRARALREFLADHYSGRRNYARDKVIPETIIRRIIARSGESAYDGRVNPDTISFMYGPDIIRDAQGTWRVIEDNPGFIGGLGDLKLAYELTIKKHPQLKDSFEFVNPKKFYKSVAVAYKEKALQYGGKAIIYMTPPYADNEDERMTEIFEAEGIEVVTPKSAKKLKINKDGVFLKSKSGKLEKVGYVFMNGEHAWIDNTHKTSRIRNIINDANGYLEEKDADPKIVKKMTKLLSNTDSKTFLPDIDALEKILNSVYLADEDSYAAGLMKAILKNRVGSNYSPGVDFIGDKEFYVYVEDLIRYYLHEEPILKNIGTKKFTDKNGALVTDLIQEVASHKDRYVIKKVDGRGGSSVYVGPKMAQAEFDAAINEVRKNPDMYIVQRFTPLSVVGDNIVDLRAISAVLPDKVIVAKTPWGRGLPKNGNGKVNLSDQGREVTILAVKQTKNGFVLPQRCSNILLPAM